jgi:arylamine N-acetyltransferase
MLFREGLRSLGYQVTSLQGRVVRGMAIDVSNAIRNCPLCVMKNCPHPWVMVSFDVGR